MKITNIWVVLYTLPFIKYSSWILFTLIPVRNYYVNNGGITLVTKENYTNQSSASGNDGVIQNLPP